MRKVFKIPWKITIHSKNIIWNSKTEEIKLISSTERTVLSGRNLLKIKDNTIINSNLCLLLPFCVDLGTLGLCYLLFPLLSPRNL